jgi:hypothetical protein
MSGGPGLGLGSKSFVKKIKSISELPLDGCPEGDHSVIEVVSKSKKEDQGGASSIVGHCPLSEVKLPR